MSIKFFPVNDTLQVEAYPASACLPVRNLVIHFTGNRPFDVIYLGEVKDLIAQLIEAMVYLISEAYGPGGDDG